MTTTRARALSAAVDLVGDQGIRALTHGRVDERAGLPRGSTSNWFRSRSALLAGVAAHIAESERGDFDSGFDASRATGDDFAAALTALVEAESGPSASRTRARYAMFLEAGSDREVLAPLLHQRAMYEQWVRTLLEGMGADATDDAVRTLMAGLEGLLLHRLTVDPQAVVAPVVSRLVRAALTP